MASSYPKLEEKTLQTLRDAANRLRIHSIRATCASNSGHPTSCCSAAEIMSALFFHTMRYKPDQPGHRSNDRFVLSKGHAAPVLYAAWAEAGYLNESDLLKLRKIDCDLEGHPTPVSAFLRTALALGSRCCVMGPALEINRGPGTFCNWCTSNCGDRWMPSRRLTSPSGFLEPGEQKNLVIESFSSKDSMVHSPPWLIPTTTL
uniref:transketolase-like protein 2 n=1 Tax=Podarcis muralis TaxID=64176 RepID=UPI00109EF572|nr:transketolase-like protein 2 [Podarcis muralis]